MPRIAKKADLDEIKRLWKLCFDDTDSFIDWNFKNNYSNENTIVAENEGKIASSVQIIPHKIAVSDVSLSMAYAWGVSTDPALQGKGFARSIFEFGLPLIYKNGYDTSALISAVSGMYEKFGYVKVCDFNNYAIPERFGEEIITAEDGLISKLDSIYKRNMGRKIIHGERSYKYWERLVKDIFDVSKGRIMLGDDAYALLYPSENTYVTCEIVGADKVPDVIKTSPVMARVVNVYETSKKIAAQVKVSAKISITDPWIKENNITISFNNKQASLCEGEGEKMNIAEFTRWLVSQVADEKDIFLSFPL